MRWLVVALLVGATPARAEDAPGFGDAERAVTMAANAFEYRDFEKVIEILKPWVNPPRIADPDRMGEARRLLGISLHIMGDVKGAREQFGHALLAKPDLKLDPFAVPPSVIETFEGVRREMAPVLDGRRPPADIARRVVVEIPHPAIAWLPFGYAQLFVIDGQRGWGAAWAALQTAGIVVNVASFFVADATRVNGRIPEERVDDYNRAVATMYVGAGIAAAAYLVSAIQGHSALSRDADLENLSVRTPR